VVRSWEHLDYYGPPFVAKRADAAAECRGSLSPVADLARVATVRHPLDQWISLADAGGHAGAPERSSSTWPGIRKFVETCLPETVIRYEDFTREPGCVSSRRMCDALRVAFDPTYKERWPDYATITGDVVTPAAATSRRGRSSPMGRAAR
jgi:hypothetical protein